MGIWLHPVRGTPTPQDATELSGSRLHLSTPPGPKFSTAHELHPTLDFQVCVMARCPRLSEKRPGSTGEDCPPGSQVCAMTWSSRQRGQTKKRGNQNMGSQGVNQSDFPFQSQLHRS